MSAKRILWFSNAPWGHSGYANQTRLAVQHLARLGHAVAVACNYGLGGSALDSADGVRLYPTGYDSNSNDIVQGHANDWEADVIVSLYDAWPLKFAGLKTPWIAWAPVDHQPAPPAVVEALKPAAAVVAYSQFGQHALRQAGLDAHYIPHGVDTAFFQPDDQRAARERLGLPADRFIAGFVGANNYFPSRKCIPQVLQAFAEFRRVCPDALLYLHTEETGARKGIRLRPLLGELELTAEHVRVVDQYHYLLGCPPEYMRDVYNAMDVLLSPSMGEGFGLPIMEAQACGTPVIATDWTSMTELVSGGWVITDYERWWSPQQAWQVIPHVRAIAEALLDAYLDLHRPGDRLADRPGRARTMALEYDFATVVAPAWDAFLRAFEPASALEAAR